MLLSVWRDTDFTSEILTNRLFLFPCNSCYMPTLVTYYSDNRPPRRILPQPVILPLQVIWKNIPHIHTIKTFNNGSIRQSHNLISISLTANHYHHSRSCTKSNISFLLVTRRHSYIKRTLSSSSHSLNCTPHSNNIWQGHQLTFWMLILQYDTHTD